MMINLKKLIYQYKYLKLESDDMTEEHSKLVTKFEDEFSGVIPKPEPKPDEPKPKEKISVDSNVKKIYKDIAKQLHPDKGGDEDDFKELNERYKSNDLLGVIDYAVENNIEISISDDDEKQLTDSIKKLKGKIHTLKGTLAYVWEYGNEYERMNVVNTLGKHLNKKLEVKNLSNEIKDKLGYKTKK